MIRAPLFLASLSALALVFACSSSSDDTNAVGTVADAGPDASDPGADEDASSGGACTSVLAQLLLPIDKVSTGEVTVVRDSGGTKKIYVDASAGGQQNAAKSPRVYLNLGTGAKVEVTDVSAAQSTDWDLSIKRTVLFTNGGDGGPGQGKAAHVTKPFASVTAADADAATLEAESFADAECTPNLDPIGAPLTTFSDWYNYDQSTNIPSPRDITYVVVGGTGQRYKVGIDSYSAADDGGVGKTTGYYLLSVAPL